MLSGGGSLLKNLDVLLREETGLPVMVSENPQLAVVLGTGKALDELEAPQGSHDPLSSGRRWQSVTLTRRARELVIVATLLALPVLFLRANLGRRRIT